MNCAHLLLGLFLGKRILEYILKNLRLNKKNLYYYVKVYVKDFKY